MIQQETLQFLTELAENNNKLWFDANRKRYDIARSNFEAFAEQALAKVAQFEDLGDLKLKEVMFRINRDVRFSADKSPYKVNFSTVIAKGGKKGNRAPYYFHLQPGESFLAGGIYQPMPEQLQALRQELDYNGERFLAIINEPSFKAIYPQLEGEKPVRPPKGYEAENPMIEFLKFKSMTVSHYYSDAEITSPDFIEKFVEHCKAMKPLLDFFNEFIAASE
jgi:uncharacterized protein (TIGR02453 family)